MSFVTVVPSYTVKNITNAEGLILDRWEPAIKAGLTVGKVQGLEGFKVLADGKDLETPDPQVMAWVEAHRNDPITIEVVTTQWVSNPTTAVRDRNETLLGADLVVVIGPVSNQNAARFLDRAFGTPGLHIVQVHHDGRAELVGAKNIRVLNERYRPEPKAPPLAIPKAPQGWGEFTAAAPKANGTKK